MKHIVLTFVSIVLLVLSNVTNAQDANDYFAGKWLVTVTGTPNGDATMTVDLKRLEGKLTGVVIMGEEMSTDIERIEEKESSVAIYYSAGGYDVYFNLEKKDENTLEGTLMDMFDAIGKRVVE